MELPQSNSNKSILLISIPIFIVILICVLFISLGNDGSNMEKMNQLFIIVILGLLLFLLIGAMHYFFGINIGYLKNVFSYLKSLTSETESPKIPNDYKIDDKQPNDILPVPSENFNKEIFNIPGNYYNYSDAKALCSAYGADLASYKQLENAYQNGAEWCNYGWSEGQMALFPTQQKTFNQLQKIPGHEHDCGRPGVNGGYIANSNVKFGVNCFGKKPRMTAEEETLMNISTPYPETAEDIAFKKRVDYWKNNINDILVSPFNTQSWYSY